MMEGANVCHSHGKGVEPLFTTDIPPDIHGVAEEDMVAYRTAYCCFESCVKDQIIEYAHVIGTESVVGKWRDADRAASNATGNVPVDERSQDDFNEIRLDHIRATVLEVWGTVGEKALADTTEQVDQALENGFRKRKKLVESNAITALIHKIFDPTIKIIGGCAGTRDGCFGRGGGVAGKRRMTGKQIKLRTKMYLRKLVLQDAKKLVVSLLFDSPKEILKHVKLAGKTKLLELLSCIRDRLAFVARVDPSAWEEISSALSTIENRYKSTNVLANGGNNVQPPPKTLSVRIRGHDEDTNDADPDGIGGEYVLDPVEAWHNGAPHYQQKGRDEDDPRSSHFELRMEGAATWVLGERIVVPALDDSVGDIDEVTHVMYQQADSNQIHRALDELSSLVAAGQTLVKTVTVHNQWYLNTLKTITMNAMDQLIATTSADDFMESVNEIKSGFTLESATNGAEVGVEWITESGDDPSGLVEDLYLNVFNKAAQGVSTAAMQARELMEQDFQRWEDEANAPSTRMQKGIVVDGATLLEPLSVTDKVAASELIKLGGVNTVTGNVELFDRGMEKVEQLFTRLRQEKFTKAIKEKLDNPNAPTAGSLRHSLLLVQESVVNAMGRKKQFDMVCEQTLVQPFNTLIKKLSQRALAELVKSTTAPDGVQDFVQKNIIPQAVDFLSDKLMSLVADMGSKVKMMPFLGFKRVLRNVIKSKGGNIVVKLSKRWRKFAKSIGNIVHNIQKLRMEEKDLLALLEEKDPNELARLEAKLKTRLEGMRRFLLDAKGTLRELFNGANERVKEFGKVPVNVLQQVRKVLESKEANMLTKLAKPIGVSTTWLDDMIGDKGKDFWFAVKGKKRTWVEISSKPEKAEETSPEVEGEVEGPGDDPKKTESTKTKRKAKKESALMLLADDFVTVAIQVVHPKVMRAAMVETIHTVTAP